MCSNKVTQLSDAECVLSGNIAGRVSQCMKSQSGFVSGARLNPNSSLQWIISLQFYIEVQYSHIVIVREDKCRVIEAWWGNVQKCMDVNNGKWSVVRCSELKLCEVIRRQVKWSVVRCSEVKLCEVKRRQVKWSVVRCSEVKLCEVKRRQVKWS